MSALSQSETEKIAIISSQITPRVVKFLNECKNINEYVIYGNPFNLNYKENAVVKPFLETCRNSRYHTIYDVKTFGKGVFDMCDLPIMKKCMGGWICGVDELRVTKTLEKFGLDSKFIVDWKNECPYAHSVINQFAGTMTETANEIQTKIRGGYDLKQHNEYMNDKFGVDWYERTGECDVAHFYKIMTFETKDDAQNFEKCYNHFVLGKAPEGSNKETIDRIAKFASNVSNVRWAANMCTLFKPIPKYFQKEGGAISDILCTFAFLCGCNPTMFKGSKETQALVQMMHALDQNLDLLLARFEYVEEIVICMDLELDDLSMLTILAHYLPWVKITVYCFSQAFGKIPGYDPIIVQVVSYFEHMHGKSIKIHMIEDTDQQNIDKVKAIFDRTTMTAFIDAHTRERNGSKATN